MKKITFNNKIFTQINYDDEDEFERTVVNNSSAIFGNHGIYIDIKKKIGKKTAAAGIPDGYYLDLKFHESPSVYIIENELIEHSLIKHISEQISRFILSAQYDKLSIRELLLKELSNEKYNKQLSAFYKESKFNNLHALLDQAVLKNDIKTLVIINEITEDLERLPKIYANNALELIEFQSFTDGEQIIHLFDPFDDDIESSEITSARKGRSDVDFDKLDTIIVPAREDGFKRAFLGKKCWYAVRISQSMIDKIKYIAAYQVKPVSGIVYYAEVERIEKYRDDNGQITDKYILFFKGEPLKLENKVALTKEYPNLAPQGCKYTSFEKLVNAKVLEDLF